MTTGKWIEPGVPHKGWQCTGIEDLGEPAATCEMCEVMPIRYVHTMAHDDYPGELGCGCICAGHMEEDPVGAQCDDGRSADQLSAKQCEGAVLFVAPAGSSEQTNHFPARPLR